MPTLRDDGGCLDCGHPEGCDCTCCWPSDDLLDTFVERWQQAQAAHNRERRRRKPRQKPTAGYRLPPWPNKWNTQTPIRIEDES